MELQQLAEDNMNLVYSIIHRYYPNSVNDEDIIQSGMMGLCYAVNTYDESKSKFSTYAFRCICNAINKEFYSRKKYKNQLSLDYDVVGEDGHPGKFSDYYIGKEDVDYVDLEGFYNSLTQTEKEVFNLRQSVGTVAEIANRLKCSKESVYQKLRKIKLVWEETNGN